MRFSTRGQLMLLVLMTLLVYFPVISAGYNPVDDLKMLSAWMSRDLSDLWGYFFRQGGYHYRPLVGVTFFFDNLFWGLEPSFMHLENIFLHLASGLLLFAVVSRLFKICGWSRGYYPLGAALLFLLHPVNTEPVSWISGRFDLFAGFLILCSLYLLLSGEPAGKLSRVFSAAVIFFLACLAKESAIFFYGGAFLLIFFLKRRHASSSVQAVLLSFPGWLVWTGTAAFYFLYRYFALSGHDGGIGAVTGTAAVAENTAEVIDKLRITFKVMGFYLKKLFAPLPLNYAIINVHEAYVLLGMILLLLVLYFLWRVWRYNDLVAVMFLAAAGMTLAGLIVALGEMAWTPLAERYLYMPSIFFVLGLVLLGRRYFVRQVSTGYAKLLIAGLFVCIAVLTFQRSMVWSEPVRFLEDTVAKSPAFIPARTDLAYLYSQMGKKDKAKQLLADIDVDLGDIPFVNADLNKAALLIEDEQFADARELLRVRSENSGKRSGDVINALIRADRYYMAAISDEVLKDELKEEILFLLQRLNKKSSNPFLRYRLAKAYLSLEKKEEACQYFREAYQRAPEDAHYRLPAGKLSDKLCGE